MTREYDENGRLLPEDLEWDLEPSSRPVPTAPITQINVPGGLGGSVDWRYWVAALVLGVAGFGLGFALTALVVAWETLANDWAAWTFAGICALVMIGMGGWIRRRRAWYGALLQGDPEAIRRWQEEQG